MRVIMHMNAQQDDNEKEANPSFAEFEAAAKLPWKNKDALDLAGNLLKSAVEKMEKAGTFARISGKVSKWMGGIKVPKALSILGKVTGKVRPRSPVRRRRA